MATIRHDLAVADLNDPPCLLGDPPIVRHDNDGVPDRVQLVQNGHQRLTAGAIQRAGRFIGKMISAPFIRARAILTRCCCPPESCAGR